MIPTVSKSLRRLHHRLIRLRLMNEHSFGQLTLRERLLHIRPVSGILLSTPAVLFMLWYSGLAVSSHLRQVSAVKAVEPLTPELFQLHLHDRLSADLRRLRMPEPLVKSELPTYNLVISNDRLSQLDSLLPPDEGKGNYVEGLLAQKNRVYEIEARYRGAKHWHWNGPQKSWKIRVKGNHLMFEGLPTFNFVNTPDPMPFNEQMVLDVARDAGLLTPAYYPFRLQLNNAFLGVYFFEAQPDEGLLRRAHRMPGSIYSGAGAPIDPQTQVSSLWKSAEHWKKVGAAGDKTAHNVRELEALLDVIDKGTAREFADFAEVSLDVEKFATFDAIDVVFGNNQHDYHQNHKLYFDPYKSRFEPIATDFRDMEHERQFNRTENPLLLRLKQLPNYLTRRNRKVYEMVTGVCAPSAIAERTKHWIELLAADQARDPYWDAYELLPVMGNYYRQLVRPMNEERQATAARMRLHEHGLRADYLRRELERLPVSAELYVASAVPAAVAPGALVPAKTLAKTIAKRDAKPESKVTERSPRKHPAVAARPNQFVTAMDVTLSGPAGFEWQEATPEFTPGCNPSEWQIFSDHDLDQKLSDGDVRLAAVVPPLQVGKTDITLAPGLSLRQVNPNPYRGRVRAEVEP
ncbi:MAG TPA: CotH kinase family protein, partial [Polyangiaceae bacterium]